MLTSIACAGTKDVKEETAGARATDSPAPVPQEPRGGAVDDADELLDRVDEFRFTRVLPAVEEERRAGIDDLIASGVDVADFAVKAVVDRKTGRAMKVGATVLIVDPGAPVSNELRDEFRQSAAALGEVTEVKLAGQTTYLTRAQPLVVLMLFPTTNALVSLQGLEVSNTLDVGRALIRSVRADYY